jgi:hypothetical protein
MFDEITTFGGFAGLKARKLKGKEIQSNSNAPPTHQRTKSLDAAKETPENEDGPVDIAATLLKHPGFKTRRNVLEGNQATPKKKDEDDWATATPIKSSSSKPEEKKEDGTDSTEAPANE